MSKKKSYMNIKNILSEGFFDNLKDYWKFIRTKGRNLSPREKKILANPKVRKKYNDWMKAQEKVQKVLDKATKELDKKEKRKR